MSSHRSGSMDYTQNSGSHYSAAAVLAKPLQSYEMPGFSRWMNTAAPLLVDTRGYPFFSNTINLRSRNDINYARGPAGGGGPGTTCSGSYTFYQRVFDDTFLFWCYYSGSTVNAAPGITDTTPNNSGFISGHSITYTTSEIVCS